MNESSPSAQPSSSDLDLALVAERILQVAQLATTEHLEAWTRELTSQSRPEAH